MSTTHFSTTSRSAGRLLDTLAFPLRALFMQHHGRWGLSSLRDERMRVVAALCRGRVLDIGCGPGNLFIKNYIGCDYGLGIDVFPYEGIGTLVEDMRHLPFADGSFDTVTLIAVGGHIPRSAREREFAEFARVLTKGGTLVMTEGEPITQFLHHQWLHFFLKLQGKVDMDTERGMLEDEQYCMPREEILRYLNTSPLQYARRVRFMWGLNNAYIARRVS